MITINIPFQQIIEHRRIDNDRDMIVHHKRKYSNNSIITLSDRVEQLSTKPPTRNLAKSRTSLEKQKAFPHHPYFQIVR